MHLDSRVLFNTKSWKDLEEAWKVKVKVTQSCPTLVTLWTAAHQAPLSMGFSRQEYWSRLPCLSPGDLPDPGIEPQVSCTAGRFFTNWATREILCNPMDYLKFILLSDVGKDWRQEEKGTTENEMVRWHHWLKGREFVQTPGVGDRQGGLACCGSWGHKELDMTERLKWHKPIRRDNILHDSNYMTFWKRQNYEGNKKIGVFQGWWGERWIGPAQKIFRSVSLQDILLMDICHYTFL